MMLTEFLSSGSVWICPFGGSKDPQPPGHPNKANAPFLWLRWSSGCSVSLGAVCPFPWVRSRSYRVFVNSGGVDTRMQGTRRPREGTKMNRRRLGMPYGARERTRKPPEMVTKGPNSEHPNEPNEPQSEARRQPLLLLFLCSVGLR